MKSKKKCLKNPIYWQVATVVFAVLFVLSFVGVIGTDSGSSTPGELSLSAASTKALNVVNNNLVEPGVTATITDKEEVSGVYKVALNLGGRTIDSYVSKDAKLLFPNAIDLTNPPTPQAPSAPQPQEPIDVDEETLMDDDAIKGDLDAPVTIVEFSEFECPFCAKFYSDTYLKIKSEYIDTGKVRIVFRDFPLGFHANAQKAAEAAECAGDQDMYYDMHDMLFEDGVVGGVTTFKKYAKELGLDTEEFDECLDSDKHAQEVQDDMAAGSSFGVSGTPAFFINGQKIVGAQPFSAFEAIIEEELAK
ncbi:thioredoxin domain-containing protein [Candidatus Woesearchaeota archaeon]|jgi:protein-disulfide isomerase|nr:thioredoxin domain-containing protein [Candidatus Woesearchaeota archaeon]MBT6519610.1 thioredoxin domain-containing protein [Candidatus Woesearchaeota archaeon]MBT7367525.1 thioredoxin domain-containing protein [Candidatus Woesearchaeota archaeon]